MIIGITGKRGHGKNAVGGLVLDHLRSRGVRVRMDSFVRRPERLLPKVSEKFAAHASETAIEQIGERADVIVENDLTNLYELNGRLEDTLFPWLARVCR